MAKSILTVTLLNGEDLPSMDDNGALNTSQTVNFKDHLCVCVCACVCVCEYVCVEIYKLVLVCRTKILKHLL